MKILHNTYCWLPKTEVWLYTQIKCLPQEFENHVVCETTDNLDQFDDVESMYCLQKRISRMNYFTRRIVRRLKIRRGLGGVKKNLQEFNPDLVHSHYGYLGWEALPEIKKGIPHVVTFYGIDVTHLPQSAPHWKKRYKELFAKVSGVFCEGEHMATSIRDLGCNRKKIYVQPLGIRLDKIGYQPRIWGEKGPLKVLLSGTFTEKKGLPYAIRALGMLAKDVDIKITIIGDARAFKKSDQLEKQRILQAVQEGDLTEKVNFCGYQPHSVLIDQSYKHHIFLSPSVTAANGDAEGGAPVTIIEMAGTGMPVVSTKHCDIPSIITDGETGLLAEERDVNGLYDRLCWLVDNPSRWDLMTNKCRMHLEEKFDAFKQGKKLAELYKVVSN